jgi:surface protein
MDWMFRNATNFNQPTGNWNTSNVTNMSYMFYLAKNFNQAIGNWNTSNVTNMSYMFYMAKNFNQAVGNWNTSNVTNMGYMFFNDTSFNQPIGNWNLTSLINNQNMLDNCGMDCTNYSTTLIGWANNINTPIGRTLGASGIKYGTNAVASRTYLLNTKGWTINGDIANGFPCCIATTSNFSQTICNSYFFNNQTLTQSGLYYDTLINSTGCDSIITLNLTIKNPTTNIINQTVCNSYNYKNQTLTQSGIYYDTLINSAGCDSIIRLNLTVNLATTTTTNTTICSSALPYSWNGQNLMVSGIYTYTTTGSNGCDSTTLLNLTVNSTSAATITLSGSAPFSWNGSTYTASGIYTYTTTNAAGCDSVTTLNLTSTVTLNITAFIQGYYNGTGMVAARYENLMSAGSATPGNATDVDFVTVELHDVINTAAVAYTSVGMLQTDGSLSVNFPGSAIGSDYYVVLLHHNALQLWSANPITISTATTYDFSSALTQAYADGSADPMVLLAPGVYGMYSGDINQDEYIDVSDYPLFEADIDNSAFNGLYNLVSDLNGDSFVDISDYPVYDVNSSLGLYSQHP